MPAPLRSQSRRLMCVLAHPDDESMGTGGILARYAAEGVETALVMATGGELGWTGDPDAYPGPDGLRRIREGELRAAAATLGLRSLTLLGYRDGELDRARAAEVIGKIAAALRQQRPQVVVTFDPLGFYGHPDHIAISQLTTAAIAAAADSDAGSEADAPPHRVAKLYYLVPDEARVAAFNEVFGGLRMEVDGQMRATAGWPSWAITTRIDVSDHWPTAWRAVACHRSQLPNYPQLASLPPALHARLWGAQSFYRAMSSVNNGRELEDDLFAGLD